MEGFKEFISKYIGAIIGVIIAVLILIYIYKVDIVNITIFDILKIIFLAILAIMVYNYVKDYHLMD